MSGALFSTATVCVVFFFLNLNVFQIRKVWMNCERKMDLAVLVDMGAELQEVMLSYFQHPSILTVHLFWGSLLKAMTVPVSMLKKIDSLKKSSKQTNQQNKKKNYRD